MPIRKAIALFVAALACLMALAVVVLFRPHSGRDSRLESIDRARSFVSTVARQESSPVVQAISKAAGTNLLDYLVSKAEAQEKEAQKSGDLVSLSLWAPSLHTGPSWREFMQRCLTNGAHFVPWMLSEDDILTGYVRQEEVAFWQSELCTITNPVAWTERRLFKLIGDDANCSLPDGSHVNKAQAKEWLNASIADGWTVGVSLVQATNRSVLVASRRITGGGAQPGAAPKAAPPYR